MNEDEKMMKMERMVRRLVEFDDSIMMMRDGIPSLSVAGFCFSFFSFFCSFLSFLLHTSGGRKAVPWDLHIDGSYGGRIDRERQRQTDSERDQRQTNGRPFAEEENEKIKF